MTIREALREHLQYETEVFPHACVNICFLNHDGEEDNTQLDVHQSLKTEKGVAELEELYASLCPEFETDPDQVLSVEIAFSAKTAKALEKNGRQPSKEKGKKLITFTASENGVVKRWEGSLEDLRHEYFFIEKENRSLPAESASIITCEFNGTIIKPQTFGEILRFFNIAQHPEDPEAKTVYLVYEKNGKGRDSKEGSENMMLFSDQVQALEEMYRRKEALTGQLEGSMSFEEKESTSNRFVFADQGHPVFDDVNCETVVCMKTLKINGKKQRVEKPLIELYEVRGVDDLEGYTFAICTSKSLAEKALQKTIENEFSEDSLEIVRSSLPLNAVSTNGEMIALD